MFKDNKFKKEDNKKNQTIGIDIVDSDSKKDNYLKTLKDTRDFSYDKFNKGKLWYENGLALEDAPEEIRSDVTFIRGYNHGKRLAFINEMDSNGKKR